MLSINRKFAGSLVFGLTIAGSISMYLGHTTAAYILFCTAALHIVIAVLAPAFLTPSRIVLESIVKLIGHSIAILVLSLFYYLVFTPFSLLWKILGKDGLRSHPPHWIEVPAWDNDPERLKRLF